MFTLIVTEKGGTPKRLDFDKDEVTIGRVPGNDIILPKGNVSKRHSRVVRQDGRFFVVDLKSTNGTYLNGRRITTPSVIRPGDKIYVGDFVVVVEMGDAAAGATAANAEDAEGGEEAMGFPPAEAGVRPPPPPEPSLVEPLPLDEEPPESSPPPPMHTVGGLGRSPALTVPSVSNPVAARATLPTHPSGSGGSPVPSPSPGPAIPGGAGATQPPPRLGARGASPGSSPQMPRLGGNSSRSPIGALGGAPGASPSGGAGVAGPSVPMPPMGGLVNASSAVAHGGSIGGGPVAAPTSPGRPALGRAEGPPVNPTLADGMPATEAPPRRGAGVPMPGQSSSAAAEAGDEFEAPLVRPRGVPQADNPNPATVNIPPAAVDAVIAAHRAAAAAAPGVTAAGEPLPAGRAYAQLLGEVANEVRGSAGGSPAADRPTDAAARAKVRTLAEAAAARRRDALPANVTVERLARDVTAEIAGAGAIEVALEEPEVTTVVVDAAGRVLVGRGDAIGPSPVWFSGDAAVISAVDRLLSASGAPRAANTAVVDATLADGARLLAVLPPVASAGPTVVIERPARRPATLMDLAARGMLSTAAVTLLSHALAARRNVLVTGPRGGGRTTLLAALVSTLPAVERVVAVEERREVGRGRADVTSIDPRSDWKRALELAVRLRPQRLVVGDVNEAGAAALAGTLATGAEGWLAALEAAAPSLAAARFAALAGSAGPASREEVLARLAATRPLVVHVARLGDGTCRVVSMGEARPGDNGGVQIDEAFALRIERVDAQGRFQATLIATGVVPSFAEAF